MSAQTTTQNDPTNGAPDRAAQNVENRGPQGEFSTRCASTNRTRTASSPLPDARASGGTLMREWGTQLINLKTIVSERRVP